MESLDRVISMYNGIWPEFDWNSNDNNQNAIVETIQVWYHDGEDKYHEVGQISKGGTAIDKEYCKVICTKEQFEQRVNQLKGEQTMTNWYDYNNQEMVSLPPVDTECEWSTTHSSQWGRCQIISHNHLVIYSFSPHGVRYDGLYMFEDKTALSFRPLDWNKDEGKNKLIDEAVQIMYDNACATKGELINGVKRLYELGYLKSPEDK